MSTSTTTPTGNSASTSANTASVGLPSQTQSSSLERVRFHDGMVVTAEDLDSAVDYPVNMLRTIVRAFFGCGVIGGLRLTHRLADGDDPSYVVCVSPGVAIDCHGFPLELCHPVELNFEPDACAPAKVPCDATVLVAVRRVTTDEAPSSVCGCNDPDPRFQCTRVRDNVMVKTFIDPGPDDSRFCRRSETDDETQDLCSCLTAPSSCDCAAESWVVIGVVTVAQEAADCGTVTRIEVDPEGARRRIKPYECLCRSEEG